MVDGRGVSSDSCRPNSATTSPLGCFSCSLVFYCFLAAVDCHDLDFRQDGLGFSVDARSRLHHGSAPASPVMLETQDQLRSLNLPGIRNIGYRTLRTISACKQLEDLGMWFAVLIARNSELIAVLTGCPRITRLRSPGWETKHSVCSQISARQSLLFK